MKQILFTFFLLSVIGLTSCRKSGNDLDIKAYDKLQIQNYITSNGLSGMKPDTAVADSTGIYYQIINPGDPTKPIDYPDPISFVYTLKSFDGKFQAVDTVANHYYGYAGHVTPSGLMQGIRNILKYKGAKVRFLIPSHLAYGINGAGSGSSTLLNGRIAGNQCLDYTVNVISDQAQYDDLVINNYLAANSLTGYTKTASGLYYKITTPGTGTAVITENSTVTVTYNGRLLNGVAFDYFTTAGGTEFDVAQLIKGVQEGLEHATVGTVISMILPSGLGYGTSTAGATYTTIPANACIRFEYTVIAITN